MIIEKLRIEDIEKYKELIDEAFDGSNAIEEYQKYDYNNNAYEILVLKENQDILASVTIYKIDLFTFSFQPVIELFNVAVRKEYRRKNLGKILIEYVVKYAKENGYNTINLTCLESEKGVHKFYENVGFTKVDSRKYTMYL